ncbi:aspartate dehydrogenase [Roseateles koreensis]|uniref:L-aspartate dehydrogenase n=1 Tax=Roseateles koreensis TaxID=2987526 RepID=A0ABT5KTV5_9BURK|nr:aspartate dehydrogenase [Roseateles koreensis]MDC8785256.1 aspartate dehydrogenase [Roseateles koreensis]
MTLNLNQHGAAAPAPLRVALIGLGAIGRVIAQELLAREADGVTLVGALCQHADEGASLNIPVVTALAPLLALKPDLVVEAAGHGAVKAYGAAVLRSGVDLLLVSVGVLSDAALHAELTEAATSAGRQLMLPSGALAGLDYLQAARLAGLSRVCLRSRKPPLAWRGTPAEGLLDLAAITVPTVFFCGSAREAARDYPKNANVAATLALCTLGMDDTRVELIADPCIQGNVHEVEAVGDAGEMRLQLNNTASPDNPKTSMVTPYSVLRSILSRRATVSV